MSCTVDLIVPRLKKLRYLESNVFGMSLDIVCVTYGGFNLLNRKVQHTHVSQDILLSFV
jgi:hypothetical protein